jgi:hypothetical protein
MALSDFFCFVLFAKKFAISPCVTLLLDKVFKTGLYGRFEKEINV